MKTPHTMGSTPKAEDSEALITLSDILRRRQDTPAPLSFAPEDPSEIRKALAGYDFTHTIPLQQVALEASKMLENWNLNTSHPRYLGLFNGPAPTSSIIADALVAAYNPQLSVWSHGAGANEIEMHVIRLFLQLFGFDPDKGLGHFTSGGSESNTTGILCALNNKFPNYRNGGLLCLKKRPILYVSEYAHHSFQKTVCSVGLGLDSLRIIPADKDLKIDLGKLQEVLAQDLNSDTHIPFCIVGSAGTTSAGVVDPLAELSELSKKYGLWFHVDAAWGGGAIFSPILKPALHGIQSADSITFDAHKWMAVSMGAGVFLCNDRETVENTFRVHADYMPEIRPKTIDLHRTSLQWSRRFIGLKVFMALAEQGLPGFQKQIEEQARIGNVLRDTLKERKWLVVNSTPLPVVCFTHPRIREGHMKPKDVLNALYERKSFWISETKIRNESVLRASITHPLTSDSDIHGLVQELESLIS